MPSDASRLQESLKQVRLVRDSIDDPNLHHELNHAETVIARVQDALISEVPADD